MCRFQELHKPAATNDAVYHSSIESLVQMFSAGYNVSLIVTGFKGSGKSYTIGGNVDDVGVVPIALQRIFCKIGQNGRYTVAVLWQMPENVAVERLKTIYNVTEPLVK